VDECNLWHLMGKNPCHDQAGVSRLRVLLFR
jgi:hypothetical protein